MKRLHQNLGRIAVMLTLCGSTRGTYAQEADDAFWRGAEPNAWLHVQPSTPPVPVRIGDAGLRTTTIADMAASYVQVLLSNGSFETVSGTSPVAVMLNAFEGSAPTPVQAPPMAVVGWGEPVFRTSNGVFVRPNGGAAAPTVVFSPGGSSLSRPTLVSWQLMSLQPVSQFEVALVGASGSIIQLATTPVGTLGPLPAGFSEIRWRLKSNGQDFAGTEEYYVDVPLTSDVMDTNGNIIDTHFVDTDGDGVPDAIEMDIGSNPLTPDVGADGDRDGWSNFDEWLRGSDPSCGVGVAAPAGGPPCVPPDQDQDGWSDWDEGLRGTPANDANCMPAATQLIEPETFIIAPPQAFRTDGSGSVSSFVSLDVIGLDGAEVNARSAAQGLAGCPVPVPAAVAGSTGPARRAVSDVALRIAAGRWSYLRSTGPAEADVDGDWVMSAPGWVAGAFVAAAPYATPTFVMALLDPSAVDGPDRLRLHYTQALRAALRTNFDGVVSPAAVPVGAMVGDLVAWEADRGDGYRVIPGVRQSDPAPAAFARVLAATPDFGALLAAFAGLLQTGGPLASEMVAFQTALNDATATDAVDLRFQISDRASVAARMHHISGAAAVAASQASNLFEPDADVDGDGWSARRELLARTENAVVVALRRGEATDPLRADTDGDGIADPADTCPNDPVDNCLIERAARRDSDGDGVIDAIDNCLNQANAAQLDANGDGMGDDCAGLAAIVEPRIHPVARVGSWLRFRSQPRAAASGVGTLSYRWYFNGLAATQDVAQPADIRAATPGTYRVELHVSAAGQPYQLADFRDVTVIGTAPAASVSITAPALAVEGQSVSVSATMAPASTTAMVQWDFGDGSTASGTTASHIFATQGARTITATLLDVGGLSASSTAIVQVLDTVPVASFDADVKQSVVTVTDTSTAYDGIASRTWDFGDGSAPKSGSLVSHTYATPGTYDIVLTATDADGSSATATRKVQVTGPGIALGTFALTTQWQTFALPVQMADALLFPSAVAPWTVQNNRKSVTVTPAAGAVRLRNIGPTTFEARYEPFVTSSTAQTPTAQILFVERGTHTFSDGTSWQADSFPLAGINSAFVAELYGFGGTLVPGVITAVQTANDVPPVTSRLRNTSLTGFEAALMRREADARVGHGEEEVAFLAVRSATSTGSVLIGGTATSWVSGLQSVRTRATTWQGCKVTLVEDTSADTETGHVAESVWLLKVGRACFAQVASVNEVDPVVVQLR